MFVILPFVAGIASRLRAFTAPAATAWGARAFGLDVSGSWLAFMGYEWTPWIFLQSAQ